MVKFLVIAVFAFLFVEKGQTHTYHMGACPAIEPMSGFEMNRMLGIWYVIQKTSTSSTCVTYNFTRTHDPDKFELIQTSQHMALQPFGRQYRYTGEISVPDQSVPAKMTIKFPLNIAGRASFTIFATDFDTYAGLFTCQKIGFTHRQSATILSRQRTLDKLYLDKLRSKLSQANIDPFDMSIISQSGCPTDEESRASINIDDDTFSAKSVAGVFRSAGEKLGDGVEYLSGGAKTIYNKVTGNVEEGMHTVEENTRHLVDRARDNLNTARGRAREDMDYLGARAREDVDYLGSRARDGLDYVDTRVREDVNYLGNRAREDAAGADRRLREDLENINRGRGYYPPQYSREPTQSPQERSYNDWFP